MMRAITAVIFRGTREEWQSIADQLHTAKHSVTARNIESIVARPDYYYLTGTTSFEATGSTVGWIRDAAQRAGIKVTA